MAMQGDVVWHGHDTAVSMWSFEVHQSCVVVRVEQSEDYANRAGVSQSCEMVRMELGCVTITWESNRIVSDLKVMAKMLATLQDDFCTPPILGILVRVLTSSWQAGTWSSNQAETADKGIPRKRINLSHARHSTKLFAGRRSIPGTRRRQR